MAFLIGTPVAVGYGLFDPIDRLELGVPLMAADRNLDWTLARVAHTGPRDEPDGVTPLIAITLPRGRTLLVSPDQPLYVGDGRCVRAERALIGGAPLFDRDGRRVEVVEARPVPRNGQLFDVTVGSLDVPASVDGHLIVAGGIICGDAALTRGR